MRVLSNDSRFKEKSTTYLEETKIVCHLGYRLILAKSIPNGITEWFEAFLSYEISNNYDVK